MSQTKMSNTMKATLIEDFFRLQGKRMTNLGKANMTKLDSIIEQYKIDIDTLLAGRLKAEELQKIQDEKDRKKREEEMEQERKEREENELKIEKMWNNLTTEQKNTICEKLKEKVNTQRQKENEFAIAATNVMEETLKKRGGRIIRESPTELRVNGIMVSNSYIKKMLTLDEVKKLMPSHLKYYKEILEEVEKLNQPKIIKKKILIIEEDEEEREQFCCSCGKYDIWYNLGDADTPMCKCNPDSEEQEDEEDSDENE